MRYLLLSLCMIVCMASCTDADHVAAPSADSQYAGLAYRLGTVNDSLMKAKQTVDTRALSPFMRFSYVTLKDIAGAATFGKLGAKVGSLLGPKGTLAGAIIGGVAGGAVYSYVAYDKTRPGRFSRDSINLKDWAIVVPPSLDGINRNPFGTGHPKEWAPIIPLNYPKGYKQFERRGAEHNYVLEAIRSGDYKMVKINEDSLSSEEKLILHSEELASAFSRNVQMLQEGTLDIYDTGEASINVALDKFYQVFQSFPETEEDVSRLVNIYANEIANSTELTEEDKSIILSSLSVAAYSFKYWETTYESQQDGAAE